MPLARRQHLPGLRPVEDDQFGEYQQRLVSHHSPPLALTQLLIAYHLLRKCSDLSQSRLRLETAERMG